MKIKALLLKYWWFIVILLVAGYYLLTNLSTGTISPKENLFAVLSSHNITRVTIGNDRLTINLERKNNEWLVNQSYPANSNSISSLLLVLSRLSAASPLPQSVNDSLARIAQTQGVNIKVYQNQRVIRNFHIYSTTTLGLETIGILSKAKKAFKLQIPNFDGNIVNLFSTNKSYWLANQGGIVELTEILAVEVDVITKPEQSFRFDKLDNGNFRLFAPFAGVSISPFDTNKTDSYFQHLSGLSVGNNVADIDPAEKSSILLMEPEYIFTFYKTNGTQQQLTIYPIPVEEYLDEFGRPVKVDLNRLYVKFSNDKDLYIVNYIDFYPILRNLSYFSPNL